MKRSSRLLTVLILLLLSAPLLKPPSLFCDSEIYLGGALEAGFIAYPVFPYDKDRFNGSLNPDNLNGFQDLVPLTDFLAKLSGETDTTDFMLWLKVKPYYLGQALIAASSGDPVQSFAVDEALPLLGSKINYIELLRANVGWYPSDFVLFKIGRQSLLTGYGYAWNPIDFFNSLKDPYDPDQELRGVEALMSELYAGNTFSLRLAAIYRPEELTGGLDFGDVQAGTELTFFLPGIEAKLTGLFDHDVSEGEDSYVSALGGGVKLDLAGIGLYGEGAVLKGSRNNHPREPGSYSRLDEWLFSGLVGLEYTFEFELVGILEYFYNGEGYDLDERRLYLDMVRDAVRSVGAPGSDLLLMFRPGFFARHYILAHVTLPVYDWNTEFSLATVFSPDSLMVSFQPLITCEVSGSLVFELRYIGLLSLDDSKVNEAWLSPVRNIIEVRGRYSF